MSTFVYGYHPVLHLLKAGRRMGRRLFLAAEPSDEDDPILLLCRQKSIPMEKRPPDFFLQKVGSQSPHQGFLMEADPFPFVSLESVFGAETVMILDGVEDPQNLGALCRSAHLFGVSGLILPKDRSATVTPLTCKASAGAVEYLLVSQVANLSQALGRLKEEGFWSYAGDPEGDREAYQADFAPKSILIIGGEGRGIRRLLTERSDFRIRIPLADPGFGSLNASVAGGVLLYERWRQKVCQK